MIGEGGGSRNSLRCLEILAGGRFERLIRQRRMACWQEGHWVVLASFNGWGWCWLCGQEALLCTRSTVLVKASNGGEELFAQAWEQTTGIER